jgi:hypothetical protein
MAKLVSDPGPSIGKEEDLLLQNHVAKVVDSGVFARAELLRKLLLYLWNNRDRALNEYSVATEALGRRADFDSKSDASVRVLISRLRRKLKDFYDTEGAGEAFELQILLGTHALTVVRRPAVDEMEDLPIAPTNTRTEWLGEHRLLSALVLVCAFLLTTNAWLLWDHYKVQAEILQVPKPTSFWKRFFVGTIPVKIILPSPVFFKLSPSSQIHVRDVDVNDFDSWQKSPMLRSLRSHGESFSLDHYYTATSATLASITLAQYLGKVGLSNRLSFETTSDTSMDLLDHASVIALGTHSTLSVFRDYLSTLDFSLGHDEIFVANAHPGPGEKIRYDKEQIGPDRYMEASLVALLPGRNPETKLLIMQAEHTAGLVDLLTSSVGNELFEKTYRSHGSPRYFEMVVQSEVSGGNILRSWPVAFHAYSKSAPLNLDASR